MASACRSCAADIDWVMTPSGKSMPLDSEPTWVSGMPEPRVGNVGIENGIAHVLGPIEAATWDGELYTSHFATCPDAAEWRKK